MKRFLSLLFLFIALCVPSYAYKDGKPATDEDLKKFFKCLEFVVSKSLQNPQYSNEKAEQHLCKFEIDKGLRPRYNAETIGISTFNQRMEKYAMQMVVGNPNEMRCRAHAAFALRQLERLGVKSGCLYFLRKLTTEQRRPSLDSGHTVIIYSALDDSGQEQYFICDLTTAIQIAHLLKTL